MAKGVKKIKWAGEGKVYTKLSKPNEYMTIAPDQDVWFTVGEWEAGTTEEDKKKDLTWIKQSEDRRTIIKQKTIPSSKEYNISLSKNLCGKYSYYIEASLGGKPDPRKVGLFVRGHSDPRITGSKWLFQNKNVKNLESIRYGDTITLRLETEGLNGYETIIVDVYNRRPGKDPLIHTYTQVRCVNGIITLEINNTYNWYTKLRKTIFGVEYKIREEEEFFVMVKKDSKSPYIIDNQNDDKHAVYLKIRNKVSNTSVNIPVNKTPTQIGKPENNQERYESCKFTQIHITDEDIKDPILLFDNGKKIKSRNPKTKIKRTIYFNFNSFEITPSNQKILENIRLFLLEHEHSTITLNGYACVIGPETYNNELSQKRSDAIQKIFIEGKLDPKRIISKGWGEINATDDKKGRDNIRYKDEENNVQARRVDISFTFTGHDAKSIIFETTAPSSSYIKNLTLDVKEMDVKKCFTDTHNKNPQKPVKITDIQKKIDQNSASTNYPVKADFQVYSNLSDVETLPLTYILPNLVSPNIFNVDVHSCRYYSENKNPTVVVHAYPDIKWMFSLYMNLSNELSVKWSKLSPAQHKKMQSKAGKIGAETRWEQTEIEWGVILEAQWNKSGGKYQKTDEFTLKFENKIKAFYNVFGGLKEISKAITTKVKGKISKNASYKIEMHPPNFSIGAEWQLARGDKDRVYQPQLGTLLNFFFNAKPLVGLEVTIDLLAVIVQAGTTYLTGGAGNAGVMKVYGEIKDWLEDRDMAFSIEFIISGEIHGEANLQINTQSNTQTTAKAAIDSKLSLEIKAHIKVEASVTILTVKAYAKGETKASAKAGATFGHSLNYKEKKLFYRPNLIFDGMQAHFFIHIEVGISSKKKWFDWKKDLADFEGDYDLIPQFDVMKELEQFTGYSPNIIFLDNNS